MNTVEFFIAVSLFLFLSATLLSKTHSLQSHLLEKNNDMIEDGAFRTYKTWINEFIEIADSSRMPFAIVIHKNGRVNFTNGSSHPYFTQHLASSSSSPQASDSISVMDFEILRTYQVIRSSLSNNGLNVYACPRYSEKYTITSEYNSFLGAASDGFIELQGESQSHRGRPACRDFQLTTSHSLNVPYSEALKPAYVKLLIPIRRHITLHHTADEIRFLSHKGDEVVENQPLLHSIDSVTIDKRLTADDRLPVFEVTMRFTSQTEKRFQAISSLATFYPYNFLFH